LALAETRPAENATGLLRELNNRNVKKGVLSADRLYISQNPDKFHALVEEYGGELLTDFRIDMLGRKGTSRAQTRSRDTCTAR
jgi:hypothetical protein